MFSSIIILAVAKYYFLQVQSRIFNHVILRLKIDTILNF